MTAAGYVPRVEDRRRIRDRLARYVRATSHRAGARSCLVELRGDVATIRVDGRTGRAHLSGMKRCGSPWSCPHCSPKVRQRRADEVNAIVEAAIARGGSAVLVTAALPHGPDDPLAHLLDVNAAVWRTTWSGRWSATFRDRWGMVGSIRALEVTWGARTGWHPHTHAVLVFDRRVDDADLVEMWGSLYLRWAARAEATTGRRPSFIGGLDLRRIDDPRNVADYVTDAGGWSIGAEVAAGPVKLGRTADRWSPLALLAGAALHGDADAADLWHEFEFATSGRRAIVASKGLAAMYAVEEATDDEAADGPTAQEVIAEVEVSATDWVALHAVDAATEYVLAVEAWALAGAAGPPPDPTDVLLAAVERRRHARIVNHEGVPT